jgi:hypothetical protein
MADDQLIPVHLVPADAFDANAVFAEEAPMTATSRLPTWDEMSDLDKGAAILHVHKREAEGDEYAVENYPARYFAHPALLALSEEEASQHAADVVGDSDELFSRLGAAEHDRLYDGALDRDRSR